MQILKSYYISRAKIFTSDNEVVPKARDDQKMYYFDHGSICLKNCKPFFQNIIYFTKIFLRINQRYSILKI